jgi:hypothetical protein
MFLNGWVKLIGIIYDIKKDNKIIHQIRDIK